MPYINIKVTDEQVAKEQKQQLIANVTKLVLDILNKKTETTHVVIDEVLVMSNITTIKAHAPMLGYKYYDFLSLNLV